MADGESVEPLERMSIGLLLPSRFNSLPRFASAWHRQKPTLCSGPGLFFDRAGLRW